MNYYSYVLLRRRRLITMTVHERYLLQVPKRRTTNNVDNIILPRSMRILFRTVIVVGIKTHFNGRFCVTFVYSVHIIIINIFIYRYTRVAVRAYTQYDDDAVFCRCANKTSSAVLGHPGFEFP